MELNNLHQDQEITDDRKSATGYVAGYPVYENQGYDSTQSSSPGMAIGTHDKKDSELVGIIFISVCSVVGILFMCALCYARIFGEPTVKVNSMSVSTLNVTADCQIIATWNISFLMKPGLESCCEFFRTEVSVLYKDEFLSGTIIGPIHLSRNDYTLFQAMVPASSRNIPDWLANAITTDKEEGIVHFNVLLGFIRDKDDGHFTKFLCKGLNIGFSSGTDTGQMLDKSIDCSIKD